MKVQLTRNKGPLSQHTWLPSVDGCYDRGTDAALSSLPMSSAHPMRTFEVHVLLPRAKGDDYAMLRRSAVGRVCLVCTKRAALWDYLRKIHASNAACVATIKKVCARAPCVLFGKKKNCRPLDTRKREEVCTYITTCAPATFCIMSRLRSSYRPHFSRRCTSALRTGQNAPLPRSLPPPYWLAGLPAPVHREHSANAGTPACMQQVGEHHLDSVSCWIAVHPAGDCRECHAPEAVLICYA
jgi:hypothetical protein